MWILKWFDCHYHSILCQVPAVTWQCQCSTGHPVVILWSPAPGCFSSLPGLSILPGVITLFMPITVEWMGAFVRLQFPRPGIRLAVAWLWNRGLRSKGLRIWRWRGGRGHLVKLTSAQLTVNSRCRTLKTRGGDQSRLNTPAQNNFSLLQTVNTLRLHYWALLECPFARLLLPLLYLRRSLGGPFLLAYGWPVLFFYFI